MDEDPGLDGTDKVCVVVWDNGCGRIWRSKEGMDRYVVFRRDDTLQDGSGNSKTRASPTSEYSSSGRGRGVVIVSDRSAGSHMKEQATDQSSWNTAQLYIASALTVMHDRCLADNV